ncbi:hypothetical protein Tco_1049892, partial [Tanacetum coccineum]
MGIGAGLVEHLAPIERSDKMSIGDKGRVRSKSSSNIEIDMIKNSQHQDMKRAQVAIIATPLMGNLVPAVEFATRLINHNSNCISVTILALSVPHLPLVDDYIQFQTSNEQIRFIQIHPSDSQPPNQCKSMTEFISLYIQSHKPIIKQTLQNLTNNVPLVGFFIDMFCTSMIDVANDLNIPCYLFFASPASYLGFVLDLTTLPESDSDSATTQLMVVKSFTKPVPLNAYPLYCINKKELGYSWFVHHTLSPLRPQPLLQNQKRIHQQQVPPNPVELPIVRMADNRPMAELLQAPTEGYEDAIVVPEIEAANFEIKHGLLTLVQNKQFFGNDKEDPHAHIRYFNKITSTLRYPNVP